MRQPIAARATINDAVVPASSIHPFETWITRFGLVNSSIASPINHRINVQSGDKAGGMTYAFSLSDATICVERARAGGSDPGNCRSIARDFGL